MSIHLEGINHSWIPILSDQQYGSLDKLVVSYLGRREVDLLASDASFYRAHAVIAAASGQFAKEDQACITEGFSEHLVQILRESDLSLWRIPDLGEQTVDIRQQDMPPNVSMVRFHLRDQRGIALHVRGNDVDEEVPRVIDTLTPTPIRNLNGIITLLISKERGNSACYKGDLLLVTCAEMYKDKQTSPRTGSSSVQRIVSGTHYGLSVISEVPQVEQPLPGAKKPKMQQSSIKETQNSGIT